MFKSELKVLVQDGFALKQELLSSFRIYLWVILNSSKHIVIQPEYGSWSKMIKTAAGISDNLSCWRVLQVIFENVSSKSEFVGLL